MLVTQEKMKTGNILSSKQKLRERMLSELNGLKEVDRAKKSLSIKEKLFATSEFRKAKIILFYASLKNEVNTDEMIKEALAQGKLIGLVSVFEKDKTLVPYLVSDIDTRLMVGPYGVRQPNKEFAKSIAVDHLNLVIVPGLAFDLEGNRLGRGKGYYDRFLETLPNGTPTIGLAFDFQIVDDLPHSSQDSPVNKVIFS
ncbi:MAG: 5-formyltetrahydrofolate cyclo-ligase [Candidatus Omnitrophica bacterium]|nr:5-formyltetrahydrofolate cyclo-ligase [Candidatus Omnitrophota bacterium]